MIIGFEVFLKILVYFLVCYLLLKITVIDLKTQIIPSKLIVAIFFISLIYKIYIGEIFDSITGMLISFFILWLIAVISKGGMGGGDIKLISALGVLSGFKGILTIISLSFILGGIVAVFLIITKVKSRKDAVPFAPFIAISTVITLLGVLFKG